MLEGLLCHTSMVQGEVVQWGIEQGVVVLQEDKELGVVEGTRLGVVLQEEKRPWGRGLGVAEGRLCGTGGQHIVQSGRQPLVAYSERGPVASMKVDC